MRHRVSHRKLGRVTEHRIAMLRNQAQRSSCTSTSRRRCRRPRSCGRSSSGSSRIAKRGIAAGDANGKSLHARRLVLRDIQDRDVVSKLFDTIAPRFEGAAGRLHAHPAARLSAAATAPKSRRSSSSAASSTRTPKRRRRKRPQGEAEGRRRPPARRGRAPARQEGRTRGRARRPKRARRRRSQAGSARQATRAGRADTRGKGAQDATAAQGRRIVSDSFRAAQLPAKAISVPAAIRTAGAELLSESTASVANSSSRPSLELEPARRHARTLVSGPLSHFLRRLLPALGLRGRDDLAVQVRRHLLVVRELHVVRAAAAGR